MTSMIFSRRSFLKMIDRKAVSRLRLDHQTCDPQPFKDALRAIYHDLAPLSSYAAICEQARVFWERYEQINRDFCPDDPVYSVVRSGFTFSTSNDAFTLICGSAAQMRILEIILGGEATSSAVNRQGVQRSTGGTTGGGAVTPELFNSRSPAATTVCDTTWSAQPTLSGNPWLVLPINALGGYVDWKAAPGEEFSLINSEQCSLRSGSGTSTFSETIIFEEL